jgi:hypothetical protein
VVFPSSIPKINTNRIFPFSPLKKYFGKILEKIDLVLACNKFRFFPLPLAMDGADKTFLQQLRVMERIRHNYFVERKFNRLEVADEMEFIFEYSRLSIYNRQDLIKELKKKHFLKLIKIHPETRHIPLHRVLMYWETSEYNSN